MNDLISSGRIVDLILLLMVLELAVLLLTRRFAGRAPRALDLLCNTLAGAGLLLALRAALLGSPVPQIAAWLVVALIGHAGDVACRFRA